MILEDDLIGLENEVRQVLFLPGWGMLSPLHYASEAGHLEVAEWLCSEGADLLSIDACGWTPLHWAARGGHSALCFSLLKLGANPRATDFRSLTPIDLCHIFRHFYLERLLD
eukprot:Selendium_serpulae@DN4784_c0_g1_i4.p2